MSRIVAIVGRPNVGKSTLFNRLIGQRKAIVDDVSGVTRDRSYGKAEWQDKEFILIDTGGYVSHSDDIFEKAIRDQVKIAMEESDVLLFMVDVTTEITDLDQQFANILRKTNKPVIVIVNKVDNFTRLSESYEFYKLGFKEQFEISAMTGSGTGDLLDKIVEILGEKEEVDYHEDLPKLAIIGRPNVGKSSLINALLGEDRNIVTPIAGTTRDTINTRYNAFGKDILLIDTAGIRKKSKVHENIEFYSVMRSINAIENCDVCALVLDATQGIESQDMNLFTLAINNGKGVIILVNKWDIAEKETNTAKLFEELIKERLQPFNDVPIVFVSALTKQRIFKAIETVMEVFENRTRKIGTHALNEFLLPIISETPPPAIKGKYVKIKYITQLKTVPPTFVFFCNLPQYVADSYKRFMENKIRANFDFKGVPFRVFFRQK